MLEFSPIETIHRTPRRTRLRIASRLASEEYLKGVQRRLAACHGVIGVRVSHRTGTVVIWHHSAFQLDSLNFAAFGLAAPQDANGTVTPAAAPRLPSRELLALSEAATRIDSAIKKATRSQADLPSVAVQLGIIVITRRPLSAALQWAAEACLKAAVRNLLTPKTKQA